MVKTLRITSVLIGAGALVLLVFSVVYGIKGDPEVRTLIEDVSPIEQFEKDQGRAAAQLNTQAKHPLVAQAELYARLLNPPRPKASTPDPRAVSTGVKRPSAPPPTAKFDLVGTCYNSQDPNRSYACVDEPGKGQYWVGVNEKIGRHVVREIRSGEVVLWNGREDETLRVPKKMHRSLLKGEGEGQAQTTSAVMQHRVVPTNVNPQTQSGRNVLTTDNEEPTEEQLDKMQQIMEKIKSMDANGPDLSEEGRKAREKMISDIMERARHMGPHEASRLRRLGTRSTIEVESVPNDDQVP